MKERLIKIIDECIEEQQKRIGELNAFLGKYELSDSGIENAREKASEELKKYIKKKVVEIHRLFEEKIKQLDEEESNDIEKKNNSLTFQQIMREKASVLKQLDCSKIEATVLADYMKEFKDYPIAIELFRSCCIDRKNYSKVIGCLPEDTRGERQERMRKSQADTIACLEGLAQFDTRGNNTQIAMIESCKDYIKHQTEDFSLSKETVWSTMKSSKAIKLSS